jgi:ribonuclease P protein component
LWQTCCDRHLETAIWKNRVTVTASVPAESNRRESKRNVEPRSGPATFPRGARLLRHADFERVYKLGRRHFSASMTVFYLPRREADAGAKRATAKSQIASGLRIGFTVGRPLGGAVQRNRMKRRLREAVRLTRPAAGTSADVVINPKKSLLTVDFTDVVKEVNRAFVAIEQKLAGKSEVKSVGGLELDSGSRKARN